MTKLAVGVFLRYRLRCFECVRTLNNVAHSPHVFAETDCDLLGTGVTDPRVLHQGGRPEQAPHGALAPIFLRYPR